MNERTISRNLFCAVLAMAGIAIAGSAQSQDPVYYVSPGLNLIEFDRENMLENSEVGFSFALGVDFDRRWSAELGFMEADPAYAENQQEADLDTWEVGLRFTLGEPGDRLRPYLSGAVGNVNVDGDNDTLVNYGAGLEFELRDQVVLRAGMSRYNYLGRDSDIGFNAGLVYYFSERNPPPPPPPEPVVVAGAARFRRRRRARPRRRLLQYPVQLRRGRKRLSDPDRGNRQFRIAGQFRLRRSSYSR